MEYVTAKEMAVEWNISRRRVQLLCMQGRINGAIKKGNLWLIPIDVIKPNDARYKHDGGEIK